MTDSNYEKTSRKMRAEFLKYDQEKMLQKFELRHDETYLYLNFCGREYRVDRNTGEIWWSEDGFATQSEAYFNETMSIYDVLCHSKEELHLSGKYALIHSLKGTGYTAGPGSDFFLKWRDFFAGKCTELEAACRKMGGQERDRGDVCYEIPVFDFLPVVARFYDADDEFPTELQLLWDENTLDYLHFETTFYVQEHLIGRLAELMGYTSK